MVGGWKSCRSRLLHDGIRIVATSRMGFYTFPFPLSILRRLYHMVMSCDRIVGQEPGMHFRQVGRPPQLREVPFSMLWNSGMSLGSCQVTRSWVSSGLIEYKGQRIGHEVIIRMIISIHFLLLPSAVVQPEVYVTNEKESVVECFVRSVQKCGFCW